MKECHELMLGSLMEAIHMEHGQTEKNNKNSL